MSKYLFKGVTLLEQVVFRTVQTIMSPEHKVKIALQCILVLTLVALCIVSFNSLLKADTSLSFKQDTNAYFPNLAICPIFSDHKPMKIESFDAVPNVSIRDFLNISIMNFDKDDW